MKQFLAALIQFTNENGCLLCYPVFTSRGIFLSISGRSFVFLQKTIIFYFKFDNYPIMCDTFVAETLNRVSIVWTLHMIMCFLLQRSVTFHILQVVSTICPISGF